MSDRLIDLCFTCAPQLRELGARSFVIGGSVGQRTGDENSDLDLFIVTTEDRLHSLRDGGLRRFAESMVGTLLLFRGPVYVEGFGLSFSAVAANLDFIQFNVNTPRTLRPNRMGRQSYIVIYDDFGDWHEFVDGSHLLAIDLIGLFEAANTFFWMRSILVWRSLRRNDLWMARRYWSDMREQILTLRRLSCGRPSINPNTPAKRIEKDLGPESLKDLEPLLLDTSRSDFTTAFVYAMEWVIEESDAFLRQNPGAGQSHHAGRLIYEAILSDHTWR